MMLLHLEDGRLIYTRQTAYIALYLDVHSTIPKEFTLFLIEYLYARILIIYSWLDELSVLRILLSDRHELWLPLPLVHRQLELQLPCVDNIS